MRSEYFATRFRRDTFWDDWPSRFCIITACATTGESWTDERTQPADFALKAELQELCLWFRRLTGYSPVTGHAEPGWAASLDFDAACDLGQAYLQDAVYFVEGDNCYLSYCDERRMPIYVGRFRCRVD